jgi:hyperosmotically inducible protein
MGVWKYWAILVLVVWNLLGDTMTSFVCASEKREKLKINVVRSPSQPVERLEREVRHELLMLPYYSVYDFLSFRVNETRVELSGYASQPTLKSDAERAVINTEGVTAVTNNIEVLPVSPNDTRIRRAVYRAIYGSEALEPYAVRALPPIHLIVRNGSIILEGVVAREMDKIIANQQANSIPGVFSVTNNLRVEKK